MYNGSYIQLTSKGRDEIGSEGTRPLDRRLGLTRCIDEAIEYTKSFMKIKPHIDGYRIYKNGQVVWEDIG